MTERRCIFAYTASTADGSYYPEYVSINRETDGRITIHVRGPRREPGQQGNTFDFPLAGLEGTMTLPDDQLRTLTASLAAEYVDS